MHTYYHFVTKSPLEQFSACAIFCISLKFLNELMHNLIGKWTIGQEKLVWFFRGIELLFSLYFYLVMIYFIIKNIQKAEVIEVMTCVFIFMYSVIFLSEIKVFYMILSGNFSNTEVQIYHIYCECWTFHPQMIPQKKKADST